MYIVVCVDCRSGEGGGLLSPLACLAAAVGR